MLYWKCARSIFHSLNKFSFSVFIPSRFSSSFSTILFFASLYCGHLIETLCPSLNLALACLPFSCALSVSPSLVNRNVSVQHRLLHMQPGGKKGQRYRVRESKSVEREKAKQKTKCCFLFRVVFSFLSFSFFIEMSSERENESKGGCFLLLLIFLFLFLQRCHFLRKWHFWRRETTRCCFEVATISRVLKIRCLFYRI